MSDLLALLRDQGCGERLPPAEVRRRGDRLRHRHLTTATVTACCVLGLLTAALASALSHHSPGRGVALVVDQGWVYSLPADFGLTLAHPRASWDKVRGSSIDLLALDCGGAPRWADSRSDSLRLSAEESTGAGWRSEIVLYVNEAAAQRALNALTAAPRDCRSLEAGWTYQDTRADFGLGGSRSVLVAGGSAGGDGQRRPGRWQMHVVQRGNALLVTQLRDGSTAELLGFSDATSAQLLADTRRLVPGLCRFDRDPCG